MTWPVGDQGEELEEEGAFTDFDEKDIWMHLVAD